MFLKPPLCFCLLVVLMAFAVLEIVDCEDRGFLPMQHLEKRNKNNGNNGNNDDFEKFFLKASKSVPRIGRRRVEDTTDTTDLPTPFWAELSDLYEYKPELFASPQLLARYLEYYNSQLPRDDATRVPTDEDGSWSRMRFKKSLRPVGDELYEYRLQP